MRALIPVLLAVLLAAPRAARAQSELEKLSAGSRTSFEGFLKPAQLARRRSATGFFTMTPGGPGFAGGVDFDLPAGRRGGSIVLGLSGFGNTIELGRSQIRPDGTPGRIDVKAFDGGPTFGYRQKLFGYSRGKVLIVPAIAAGLAPLSVYKVGYLQHRDGGGSSTSQLGGGAYDHVDTSGGYAPLTGYASAGVNVALSQRCSIGVEARCYKDFLSSDPAAFLKTVGLTFTYSGKR